MKYLVAFMLVIFTTVSVAKADTNIRIASSFPAVSTFNEQAQFIADRVKVLTEGKVTMEVKPSGALVPAFQVLDATASGAVEAAWTQSYYWVGKIRPLPCLIALLEVRMEWTVLTSLDGCSTVVDLSFIKSSIKRNSN